MGSSHRQRRDANPAVLRAGILPCSREGDLEANARPDCHASKR